MIQFSDFEKKIKVVFEDKDLLKQAFTHRSYINENPGLSISHNERLEFLGDAVLELIVTDFLYRKYPNYAEGELTAVRSALVNAIIISEVAGNVGMNDYLLLSKGEAKDNGKARQYILANTYEAFIGALYLDAGIEQARRFVRSAWGAVIEAQKVPPKDAKTGLQEWAMQRGRGLPTYKVVAATGPSHAPEFEISVSLGKETQTAKGSSKRQAEQEAAAKLLEKLQS